MNEKMNYEIVLYADTIDEVDAAFADAVKNGAEPVLEPTTEPWGQRTCYIADPEGNLIEIASWNKPYEEKDLSSGDMRETEHEEHSEHGSDL